MSDRPVSGYADRHKDWASEAEPALREILRLTRERVTELERTVATAETGLRDALETREAAIKGAVKLATKELRAEVARLKAQSKQPLPSDEPKYNPPYAIASRK